MSFLLGVHSSVLESTEVPGDVHIVDIDNSVITSQEELTVLPPYPMCKTTL
jgi:hypothetical protein